MIRTDGHDYKLIRFMEMMAAKLREPEEGGAAEDESGGGEAKVSRDGEEKTHDATEEVAKEEAEGEAEGVGEAEGEAPPEIQHDGEEGS